MDVINLDEYRPNSPEIDSLEDVAMACLQAAGEVEFEWGTHMLAKVLVGSSASRVTGNDLDRAECYGALAGLPKDLPVSVFKFLLNHGLVQRNHQRTIGLTVPGRRIVEGEVGWSDEHLEVLGRREAEPMA
jgi:superfamily II DNA helicase RecQ